MRNYLSRYYTLSESGYGFYQRSKSFIPPRSFPVVVVEAECKEEVPFDEKFDNLFMVELSNFFLEQDTFICSNIRVSPVHENKFLIIQNTKNILMTTTENRTLIRLIQKFRSDTFIWKEISSE